MEFQYNSYTYVLLFDIHFILFFFFLLKTLPFISIRLNYAMCVCVCETIGFIHSFLMRTAFQLSYGPFLRQNKLYVIYLLCITTTAPFFPSSSSSYIHIFFVHFLVAFVYIAVRARVPSARLLSLSLAFIHFEYLRSLVRSFRRSNTIMRCAVLCLCACMWMSEWLWCVWKFSYFSCWKRLARHSKPKQMAMTSSACDLLNFMTLRIAFLSIPFVNISIIHFGSVFLLARTHTHQGTKGAQTRVWDRHVRSPSAQYNHIRFIYKMGTQTHIHI